MVSRKVQMVAFTSVKMFKFLSVIAVWNELHPK